MNLTPPQIHLLLNHVPVVGAAGVTLMLAVGVLRKREEIVRMALGFALLVALITIPVYRTGEPAEQWIKKLPGVTESVIAPHESAANVAFACMLLVGAISGFGLGAYRGKPLPGWMPITMLTLMLAVSALMAVVAHRGGMIRHTEIRADAVPPEQGGEH